MSKPDIATPGIEVQELTLNKHELGFLSGMFEAWANQTLTEAEFRLLIEQVTETKEG